MSHINKDITSTTTPRLPLNVKGEMKREKDNMLILSLICNKHFLFCLNQNKSNLLAQGQNKPHNFSAQLLIFSLTLSLSKNIKICVKKSNTQSKSSNISSTNK